MKAPKPVFVCQECGAQAPKWMGRCVECGAWNALVEERPVETPAGADAAGPHRYSLANATGEARLYAEIESTAAARLSTGIGEFDRVLGGGVVPGSLVLLGGEPGIGKSTLLLQAAAHLARELGPVLYSLGRGVRAPGQVARRAPRDRPRAALPAGRDLPRAHPRGDRPKLQPALVIVDSIQTVFSLEVPVGSRQHRPGAGGGHAAAVRRQGPEHPDLPGRPRHQGRQPRRPKALEHVVDTVLYFEGERHHSHRVVRAVKNRFGAISELGVFEMTGAGLRAVPNPSKLFLAERPTDSPGSAVLCSIEGSRPMLVEVQALVSTSSYGNARRMASGIDQQRLTLLLAVLEKRAGLNLLGEDVFVNVAGGMTVDEPAADLGILAAVASSVRNRPIPSQTAMFGEIGLAGEVRGISQAPLRIREAAQMGFGRCVVPEANLDPDLAGPDGGACELVGVRTVGEALDVLLG